MLRNGLFGRHEKRLDIIYSAAFIRKAGKTDLGAAHIVVIEATFSCPTKELAVVCLFNFFSLIVFAFFSAFFLSPCEIMNEKEKWLIFALWKLFLSLSLSPNPPQLHCHDTMKLLYFQFYLSLWVGLLLLHVARCRFRWNIIKIISEAQPTSKRTQRGSASLFREAACITPTENNVH